MVSSHKKIPDDTVNTAYPGFHENDLYQRIIFPLLPIIVRSVNVEPLWLVLE